MATQKFKTELLNRLNVWWQKPQIFVREVFGVTPDAWQDSVLEAFPHKPRLAMKASKGPGKAQPKNMPTPTPSGVKKFCDLRVGDEVFAGDGTICHVRAIYDRGTLPIYKITFDDDCFTYACGEHLWKVRGAAERVRKHRVPYRRETQDDDIWSVLSTDEIIARGVRNKNGRWAGRQFEIPRQGPAQFPKKSFNLDPYVLGIWLGDGVRRDGVYATKPTPEIEHEIRNRGYKTHLRNNLVQIYGIAGNLRDLGILNLYSHQRWIPEEYLYGSITQRRDLLCGLMDADGEIASDGHMGFSSTSSELIDHVTWLVRSLGGVAYRKKIKKPFYYGKTREKIEGRPCHRLTINLPFNPFLVPQRRARWKDPLRTPATARYMTRKIDHIEPAGESDCMCIEVDHPSSLYLTNDFIVTHNTCVEAWLAWNFLVTRPHPNIAATSISADNLRDNLWKEMAVWRNTSPMLQDLFEWQKERIFARDHPETWFMSARSWAKSANDEELGLTMAGLHSDYVMAILDESGGMPIQILQAAEGVLSSAKEGHIVQAGNTNTLDGALYYACVKRASMWHVVVINGDPDNPLRSPRINLEWAEELIRTEGRDSPFVKVMLLGEWPSASLNALIGPEDVEAAMGRCYREFQYAHAPKILGVDVARQGDDSSIIFPRQGLVAFPPQQLRNADSNQGAGAVVRKWKDWDADACFIDMTGGFGAGWFDAMALLGKTPVGVQYAGRAHNPMRYVNKRVEMYFDLVKWIKDGGQLPPCPEILAALPATLYTFQGDRLLLEPKEVIKAKIGFSPDHTDGLAQTFAEPVSPRQQTGRVTRHKSEYNPFEQAFQAN